MSNSRTSDDIEKQEKPKQRQKNMTMTSCKRIVKSLLFFQFMANLEQSRSRSPKALSVELTFSSIVTLYLTKTENRIKKSLTQLSHYCFEKRYNIWQKMLVFSENKCWYQQNWEGHVTKRYIFWNYICVCSYVPNFKFLA